MKKSTKKVLSAVMAAFVAAASIPFGSVGAFTYQPITGTAVNDITFKKYLVMDETAHVPNATFRFTLTPGTAIPAEAGKMEVKTIGGTDPITDAIAPVTFAPTDTTYDDNKTIDTTSTDKPDTDNIVIDAGQKYAKKETTVTLPSSVQFKEPGVYRFAISEVTTETTGVTVAATPAYLDVYIHDEAGGTLSYAGYVIHNTPEAPSVTADQGTTDTSYPDGAKIDGLVNTFVTKNLRVGKLVDGNQGSRDKYFKLTVTVDGVKNGDTFTVSLSDDSKDATIDGKADATSGTNDATKTEYKSQSNPTTLTASGTTVTGVFYLQNGQYVAIRGLPAGASYTVTEDAEDYAQAKGPTIDSIAFTDGGDLTSGAISGNLSINADVANVGFINSKTGTVPTGILLTYTPIVVIGIFAVAGIIFLSMRRRKAE